MDSKQVVSSEDLQLEELFYSEWLDRLRSAGTLSKQDTPDLLLVNKGNLASLLKTLDLEQVVKASDGSYMLDFYEYGQAPFSTFYKDLLAFIYKTSNTTSEEEYMKIVDAYTTPAERIIKTLVQVKGSQLVKGDAQMEREINYCINKISERKIFTADQHQEAVKHIMHRPSIRQKKSNLIHWLNQYSEQNEEALIQKGKRDTHEA